MRKKVFCVDRDPDLNTELEGCAGFWLSCDFSDFLLVGRYRLTGWRHVRWASFLLLRLMRCYKGICTGRLTGRAKRGGWLATTCWRATRGGVRRHCVSLTSPAGWTEEDVYSFLLGKLYLGNERPSGVLIEKQCVKGILRLLNYSE